MTRVNTQPNFFGEVNDMDNRLAGIQRANLTKATGNMTTTGLSSAQIDTAVFGGTDQPYDGVQITDSVNHLLLVRVNGQWGKVTLTLIP